MQLLGSFQQVWCFSIPPLFLVGKNSPVHLHFWFTILFSAIIQGEAKSAQLIGDAISNNPAFITLRKIEASREIANTISTSQNRVFLSADSLLLNLQDLGVEGIGLSGVMKSKNWVKDCTLHQSAFFCFVLIYIFFSPFLKRKMQSPQCQWVEKYQLEIEEFSTLVKWNHTGCYLAGFLFLYLLKFALYLSSTWTLRKNRSKFWQPSSLTIRSLSRSWR